LLCICVILVQFLPLVQWCVKFNFQPLYNSTENDDDASERRPRRESERSTGGNRGRKSGPMSAQKVSAVNRDDTPAIGKQRTVSGTEEATATKSEDKVQNINIETKNTSDGQEQASCN